MKTIITICCMVVFSTAIHAEPIRIVEMNRFIGSQAKNFLEWSVGIPGRKEGVRWNVRTTHNDLGRVFEAPIDFVNAAYTAENFELSWVSDGNKQDEGQPRANIDTRAMFHNETVVSSPNPYQWTITSDSYEGLGTQHWVDALAGGNTAMLGRGQLGGFSMYELTNIRLTVTRWDWDVFPTWFSAKVEFMGNFLPEAKPGDYNANGEVDAADYVAYRNSRSAVQRGDNPNTWPLIPFAADNGQNGQFGQALEPYHYDLWKANYAWERTFPNFRGRISEPIPPQTYDVIPEPNTSTLVFVLLVLWSAYVTYGFILLGRQIPPDDPTPED